jgi:hypothetical protein
MKTPVPVMKGGAKEHILDILKKYAQPLNIYIGIILVLAITYIGQIPKSVAYTANSLLGRLILFILTVTVADTYSWVYGLLMALFVVLIIAVSPRSYKEGFGNSRESSDIDTEIKLVTQKRKWWSEEILQENPLGIEEEKVKTQAIQDNSNTNSSTNSSK